LKRLTPHIFFFVVAIAYIEVRVLAVEFDNAVWVGDDVSAYIIDNQHFTRL